VKILIVHGRYRSAAPSGENRVVDQEAAALLAAGHEVELYQSDSDDIADMSVAGKAMVPVQSVWNGRARHELARRLASAQPDVVHVHNTFPRLSPSVLYACRDARTPVVATIHNYRLLCAGGSFFRDGRPCHDCLDGPRTRALQHGCYRDSRLATLPVVANLAWNRSAWRDLVSAYIFVSASQRDLMKDLALPEERVFVKHNLVPAPIATRTDADTTEHMVLYLGRLDAAKGVPLLMRAWDVFREGNPDSALRLVVAGSGPLHAEVRQWGSTHSSVDVVGLVAPEEAARLRRRALAAVVPSVWEETFGLVAVEAMAAGVAPIAAARGAFPELVDHGVNGALFAPESSDALADVFADVDRAPQSYREYGRRGVRSYDERFRPAGNLEELLAVYRFAIAHRVG
jgi:glycosyltransferase involved in cell wall biosynthesis